MIAWTRRCRIKVKLQTTKEWAYSTILCPCDQTSMTLSGVSRDPWQVNATVALSPACPWFNDIACAVSGCIRRWYWGLTMYVGYVQFPPAFLLFKLPTSYISRHLWWCNESGSGQGTFFVNSALAMNLSQQIEVDEYTMTVYPTSSNNPSYDVKMDNALEASEICVRTCFVSTSWYYMQAPTKDVPKHGCY